MGMHGFAGGGHDLFLGHVRTELRGDAAAPHDDDAMCDAEAFADLRGGVDDGKALPRKMFEDIDYDISPVLAAVATLLTALSVAILLVGQLLARRRA